MAHPSIHPTLHTAPRPDVIVIGGGIIGSSIALRLAQAGLRVEVFDRADPGAEASSAAAGMLAPQGEKTDSPSFTDLCWSSHSLYPEFVAEVEGLSGQQVGYRRDGSLMIALDEDGARELDEIEADRSLSGPEKEAGATVERLSPEAASRRVPGLAATIQGALSLAADHWVDNRRLTAAVIEAARRKGAVFHAHAPITRLAARAGRLEGITQGGEQLSAGEFILAAGCWSGVLAASAGLDIPTVPCRGQMIEFELESELPQVIRAGHHYLVPRAGRRALVGTTSEYAGFDKKVTAEGMASILQPALDLAPFLAHARFVQTWAGLRPDTVDHLPVLGRSGIAGLTLATGHFRNGILLAPITARLIAGLITAGSSPSALNPFRVNRFQTAEALTEAARG